jgi:hypothetical protein
MKIFSLKYVSIGVLLFFSACAGTEEKGPTFSDRGKVMEHFAKVTSKNEFFASGTVFFPFFTIGTLEWPHLKQWGGKEILVKGVNKAGTNYHAVFLVEGEERRPVCVAVFEEGRDGEWKPRERNGENW